jgi:hypothetical protein
MDLHQALVLSHILATAGLFAATGAEHSALQRLTRTTDAPDARHRLAAYRNPAGGTGHVAMVVLLISGVAMGFTRWGLEGWRLAALIGVVTLKGAGGIVAAGPVRHLAITLREPSMAVASAVRDATRMLRTWSRTRAGVLVGIVVVMALKQSFLLSVATIASAGAIVAALPRPNENSYIGEQAS